MKIAIKLLAALALALTTFMQHSTASAASVFKFRGESVQAFFSSSDECVITQTFVSATEGSTQSAPGKPSPNSNMFIFVVRYDFCADELLFLGSANVELPDEDFEAASRLASATLITTVTIFDFVSETPVEFSVDLAWTAVGPLTRQKERSHSTTADCKIFTSFKGESRFAVATGSVSDGTTNFTPEPSVDAGIFSAKSGEVRIGCN